MATSRPVSVLREVEDTRTFRADAPRALAEMSSDLLLSAPLNMEVVLHRYALSESMLLLAEPTLLTKTLVPPLLSVEFVEDVLIKVIPRFTWSVRVWVVLIVHFASLLLVFRTVRGVLEALRVIARALGAIRVLLDIVGAMALHLTRLTAGAANADSGPNVYLSRFKMVTIVVALVFN